MSRITIEEIGKKAGVSKTTVSLIINEKASQYRISAETCKKVFKVIEENDFVANQQAKNFRLKKTFTIGLIIPDFKNHFFTDLVSELELIGRKKDYIYLIGTSNDEPSKESRIIDRFMQHNVDGFIIASASDAPKKVPPHYVPTVYVDRKVDLKTASSVISNNFEAAKQITDFLLKNNLKKTLFLNGKDNISTSAERKNGFISAYNESGEPLPSNLIVSGDHTKASGYTMLQKHLEKAPALPDCIFTASWSIMEGVLDFIKKDPSQFLNTKLATFDYNTTLDYLPFKSVSIQQNTNLIASASIDILLNMMAGAKVHQNKTINSILITNNF